MSYLLTLQLQANYTINIKYLWKCISNRLRIQAKHIEVNKTLNINTFPSQRLVFEKNEPFLLENALNLLNFLVEIVIQNSCVKFDTFSRRNGSFVSLKNKTSVKLYYLIKHLVFTYIKCSNSF